MANEGAPAGGRKYFLVHPDTFELLVQNFEHCKSVKQTPGVKLAVELECKVKRVMTAGGSLEEMRDLIARHCAEIIRIYKVSEFYERQEMASTTSTIIPKAAKRIEQPIKREIVSPSPSSSTSKKMKNWVSFRE